MKKAIGFILAFVLYVVTVAGVIWFAADMESRIRRLETIIVDSGLWPAGEPGPRHITQ